MHQLMRRVALGLTLPLAVGAPVVFLADAAHAAVTPTVTLSSPSNPSKYGEVVHLSAHVFVGEGDSVTAGSIQFRVDSVEIGAPVHLNAAGNALSPPLFDEGGVLDVTIGSDFYLATAEFIPDDTMVYTGANASPIQQRVDPAGSSLAILPTPTSLVADLSGAYPGGVQEGSAPPSGSVHFFVGGQDLPAPIDPNTGRATLNHVLPPGPQTVTATYGGDSRYTGSSEGLVRNDPTISARVLSTFPRSKSGWYRTPVDIWFICRPAGSELVEDCPTDLSLRQSGKDQSVTRTIRAVDGGSASVTVTGIDIDRDKPVIKVNGRTCTATDKLSGVKGKCRLKIAGNGHYVAIAKDKAGNRAVEHGSLD